MQEKKLYYRYETRELRIEAWKRNRISYSHWRTGEGRIWVDKKRKVQSDLCFICLKQLNEQVHVDHIFPLFMGGTNSYTNLCITHPVCNMDKGAKVTMSYKQACKRRHILNEIRLAKRTKSKLDKNPNYKLHDKQTKRMKKYSNYT